MYGVTQVQFDGGSGIGPGTYRGARGYFDTSHSYCGHYSFLATVSDGLIWFESDGHYWQGRIDMATGEIDIPNSGVSPPYRRPISIHGHYSKAVLSSGDCGLGYFILQTR
jgi:hypothetical protein